MQQNIIDGLGQIVKGKIGLTWKSFLLIISLIVSIGLYLIIINTVEPNSNILRSMRRIVQTPNYKFFSGGEKGVYYTIVSTIQSGIRDENLSFEIENKQTSGGSENAIEVLTTPGSFGLVQEETIKKEDFIRDELNYIAPLYIERMHIILRIDKNNKYAKLFSYENPPVLSSNTDDAVLELFANSKISTGPVGSGSIVIASYILSELNQQIKDKNIDETQEIYNLTTKEGLYTIQQAYEGENKIDILFTIAGAPIKDVKALLQDDNFMLISVDPSFVSELNIKNDLNLRLTDFKSAEDEAFGKGIYKNSANVSALGSYAWLISSKDIPNKDILDVLRLMKEYSDIIATNLGVENTNSQHSPLKEMNFYDLYKTKYDRGSLSEWRTILIFFSTFIISFVSVFSFLLYILSFRKQSKYFHKIVDVINAYFPANTELDSNEYIVGNVPEDIDLPFQRPRVLDKQTKIIDQIIIGIQQILLLTKSINDDFQGGSLTNSNYTFLMNKIEDTRNKLRKHLGRRLNEIIERDTTYKNVNILDDLRIYYTAGYLLHEDYKDLKTLILDK
ncbi:MAG: hypothetical protein AAF611_02495 [Bacteroidota bacterium]